MKIRFEDFGFSNEFTFGNKLHTAFGSPPLFCPGTQVQIRRTLRRCVESEGHPMYTSQQTQPFDRPPAFKELREWVLSEIHPMPFHMSRKCEKLLKKFLILNPSRRGTLEPIEKDPWMKTGHEAN